MNGGENITESKELLKELAYKGLEKRKLSNNQEARDRLEHELSIILNSDLENFFLNTSYVANLLKSKGIRLGPARGSAGGSLTSYCLNITEINPLKYNLSFARFLNEERASHSMSDIDIDIPRDKRQESLNLIKKEFGQDKAFQVINQIRFTDKTSIKALARIYDVPFDEVNRITSLINSPNDINENERVKNFLNKYPEIKENMSKINGMLSTYGVHAGALILFPESIESLASTVKVNNEIVCSYDGRTCDDLMLLKQDLLGLNTLTIINDCINLVDKNFKFPEEFNDPKVYENIQKSCLGIFQLESSSAEDFIRKLKPTNFDDLVAALALIRPGSAQNGDDKKYIQNKNKNEIEYEIPELESILEPTKDCLIYQEQAMQIAKELAGFSDSEADTLRKGIGKKIKEVFDTLKPKFFDGCLSNNISYRTINDIWNKIEKSSEYSFNKSHAVGYATIAYQTAYLKTYHPISFYLALLNNTDDEEKRMRIYSELRSINKPVKNPDINKSKDVIKQDGEDIYLSLSLIKNVGDKAIKNIIELQPFESFDDFIERRDSRKVNKRVVNALIESGAFDCFNKNRFELYKILNDVDKEWSKEEELYREFNVLKINPRGNLLSFYDTSEFDIDIIPLSQVSNIDGEAQVYTKALIADVKLKEDYGFFTLTDNNNQITVTISKNHIDRYIDTFNSVGEPVLTSLRTFNGKVYFNSLISLKNKSHYNKEYDLYTGKTYEILEKIQQDNPVFTIGVATNINYFTSKKGNKCLRYDLIINKEKTLLGCMNCFEPPLINDGSYIFLNGGNKPFFNIVKIV